LRETEEMLIKKQEFLEKKIEQVNFLSISGFSLIIYNNELKITKTFLLSKLFCLKNSQTKCTFTFNAYRPLTFTYNIAYPILFS
jgi:hypothetical protein